MIFLKNKQFFEQKPKPCGLCCTKIANLNVRLGGSEILRDVNIHIHCGELTSVIGLNGAGKSTLLKAILGEVAHDGELRFLDSKSIHSKPLIGYVPQHLDFDSASPVSVLDLFLSAKSRLPVWLRRSRSLEDGIERILASVDAAHLLHRRLGELSGGELQRVLLALALDPVPDLLLLDEPVSGVDIKGMETFYSIVADLRNKYDLSIILVSHDLPLVAKYSDRVILLDRTVVKSGTPEEVFKSGEFIDMFGNYEIPNVERKKIVVEGV